jgi:arylsulfatase A-like enzyme
MKSLKTNQREVTKKNWANRLTNDNKTNKTKIMNPRLIVIALSCLLVSVVAVPDAVYAQDKKPNILVIWGDDIGWYNPSIYHRGDMGYWTPNIDRIGKEGAMFTCCYGQQSCTAGRAAFITGQSPIRTGLTKVGLPGADIGLSAKDPTIAELLKPLGYATGQFGKNHLGDKDEFLPTNHGFDEFFGNLYHLNAEEEPENVDYPKNPEFKKKFGPRGVIHSYADGNIEDTGPLTKKRMETVDEEFLAGAMDFIDRQQKAGKPFFVWFNSTRMHVFTHLKGRVTTGEDGPRSLSRRDGRARRHGWTITQET